MKPDPHIAHLLERYMLAETTKAEERELADYFKTHPDLPAEWLPYAVMFLGGNATATAGHKRRLWPWLATIGTAACVALVLLLWPGTNGEMLVAQSADPHTPAVVTSQSSGRKDVDAVPVLEEGTTAKKFSHPVHKAQAQAGPIPQSERLAPEITEAERRREIELLLEAQAMEREDEEIKVQLLVEVLLAANAQE